eukprot:IDg19251t1
MVRHDRTIVPVSVQATNEREFRIYQLSGGWGHFWLSHGSWRFKLEDRGQALVTPYATYEYMQASVVLASSEGEKVLAEKFFENSRLENWVLALDKFDQRTIEGFVGLVEISSKGQNISK